MGPNPFEAAVFYFIFLFSTTLHEAAHAWVALRGGDPTAYHGGQVSINPLPHIRREPFGMVILPLLSVFLSGWPMGLASAPLALGLLVFVPQPRITEEGRKAQDSLLKEAVFGLSIALFLIFEPNGLSYRWWQIKQSDLREK